MVYIVRKQRGGMISMSEAQTALGRGQLDAVDAWFEIYGTTEKIHDAIRQLRVFQPFTSDSAGEVAFQADYLHLLGNPFTVYGSTITKMRFISEDEFANAMTSQLREVSNDYPIAVNSDTGFTIYPQQVQVGSYWYIRTPNEPIIGYTQTGRTITYDPGSSVQLEFTDNYINNIIARALVYVGVNLDETGVAAFAQQYKTDTE